ncbi:PspC domain-containing protein [bacterium]|nr:PspC domain-containing protein [bacterium]
MLKLNKSNRKICGVCSGFADYFNVDPTLVRIIFTIITLTSCGYATLFYFLCAIIMSD